MTSQQIMAWNPDMIFAEDGKSAAAIESDPQWAGIKAVKDGRVFVQPSLPFGWFDSPPGVNRLIGLRWLETLLLSAAFQE